LTRELILLGTGTSVGVPVIGCRCPVCTSTNPRNQRTRTGVLVQAPEGNFLIDTPPELRLQLIREHIDLVHAAVFTHSHADHIFGLDDLRIFGYRLDRAIGLYCEEAVERQLRAAFGYAFEPPDPEAHHFAVPKLAFERITTEPFDLLGQRVQPIRLMHGKLPLLGFRMNDVAYCTDVSFIPEQSWPLLQGLDTLVIDALRDQPHPTHFSVGQALEVISRLKPRRAYFTHVSHSLEYEATNARLPAGVELSYDGQRIAF
jgi:phosphoribosyl 1,2-cyclic phosphate phosphodiesterase